MLYDGLDELQTSLDEVKEAFGELAAKWPSILLTLLFIAGTVCIFIYCLRWTKRNQRRILAEQNEFQQRAQRVVGQMVRSETKVRLVEDGRDSEGKKDYRRENYLQVTYSYHVDGIQYTSKFSFEMGDSYPRQHEFLLEPGKPQKAYWSAGTYRRFGRGSGWGCLTSIVLWIVLANILGRIFMFFGYSFG